MTAIARAGTKRVRSAQRRRIAVAVHRTAHIFSKCLGYEQHHMHPSFNLGRVQQQRIGSSRLRSGSPPRPNARHPVRSPVRDTPPPPYLLHLHTLPGLAHLPNHTLMYARLPGLAFAEVRGHNSFYNAGKLTRHACCARCAAGLRTKLAAVIAPTQRARAMPAQHSFCA